MSIVIHDVSITIVVHNFDSGECACLTHSHYISQAERTALLIKIDRDFTFYLKVNLGPK